MSARLDTKTITVTSPASASTVVHTETFDDLEKYDWFMISATLTGATGGTLDVYLQRKLASNTWEDWAHFTQLAAAASTVRYVATPQSSNGFTTVGGGTDASPGVALASGSLVGGHPGSVVRIVFVAGAGTSAGASQVIRLQCWKSP